MGAISEKRDCDSPPLPPAFFFNRPSRTLSFAFHKSLSNVRSNAEKLGICLLSRSLGLHVFFLATTASPKNSPGKCSCGASTVPC